MEVKEKEIIEKMRDKLAEARQKMFMSQPGEQEAYYDGKASALAEVIEAIEEECPVGTSEEVEAWENYEREWMEVSE